MYSASLVAWPDVRAEGATEEEAIRLLQTALAARLGKGKLVPLEFDATASANPWLALADALKENPLLDEVNQEIVAYRAVSADPVEKPV
jgi:hypothetical protein